jgi:hypothetical protein
MSHLVNKNGATDDPALLIILFHHTARRGTPLPLWEYVSPIGNGSLRSRVARFLSLTSIVTVGCCTFACPSPRRVLSGRPNLLSRLCASHASIPSPVSDFSLGTICQAVRPQSKVNFLRNPAPPAHEQISLPNHPSRPTQNKLFDTETACRDHV